MLENPLVRAFETGTIDASKLGHREHLRVAWCYLSRLPLEEALARYVRNLRALTERLGVPGKYHATITWSYLLLVDELMRRLPGAGFDELLASCPALLDGRLLAGLGLHRDAETRARFVLPRVRAVVDDHLVALDMAVGNR
jgi:hypothetical protein